MEIALADILSGLENGNTSAFLTASNLVNQFLLPARDADVLIKCIDGYGRSNYTTVEDYENYIGFLDSQSKYFGEVWPNNVPLEFFVGHSSFRCLRAWSFTAC
jgi:hypothetical protein